MRSFDIHISADYGFSRNSDAAHVEEDGTGPINVYGRAKLEGEQRVAAANARSVILRTSWVYSPFGTNFARSILKAAQTRGELNVVSDFRGKHSRLSTRKFELAFGWGAPDWRHSTDYVVKRLLAGTL